jgi:hypothetical protein
MEHRVDDHAHFETVAVTTIDDRTIRVVGRKDGATVVDSTTVVGREGADKIETRDLVQADGRVMVVAVRWRRVGPPPPGAHLISGRWLKIEADLVNHDEDTTYRIVDDALEMHDRMGRSFRARLDGTIAAYNGDARFTAVSVRWLDDRTIEESDRDGDDVVFVAQWRIAPDGNRMHVRFDDTHGHVMEQTGHRVG